MNGMCILAAVVLLAGAPLSAQRAALGVAPHSRPAEEGPEVKRLTVRPAAAPEAALDYQLLPPVLEETPGDALGLYYIAIDRLPAGDGAELRTKLVEWSAAPVEKLPRAKVQEALAKYETALGQVALAARRQRCDWGYPVPSQGYNLILPPLGKYRDIARVLQLDARLHIAAGEHDEAIRTLQTGYAMARHLAEGPTVINALVGVAVAAAMDRAVVDLMEAPEGPNLYWALAQLPRPIIDLRRVYQYEASCLYQRYPLLAKARKGKLTPGQEARLREEFAKAVAEFGNDARRESANGPSATFTITAMRVYPRGKKHLAAKGYTPGQIEAMPVATVVAMYSLDRYHHWRDELFKWHVLPYWQAHEGMQRAQAAFGSVKANDPAEGWPFTRLVPALGRAYFLSTRLNRQLAALQTIEAVRIYAADHAGKLPDSLADLTAAPAPIDPITGNVFKYEVEANAFTLTAPAPTGNPAKDGTLYEVTIRP